MRKRFQRGNIRKIHGSWIGRYYQNPKKRVNVLLGRVSEMTKSQAREKLAEILRSINARAQCVALAQTFGDFVEQVFFPLKRDGWKASTAMTTPDRIRRHLVSELGKRQLREITRDELQTLLKTQAKFSFSTVDHLKWDLVDIFKLAVADGYIRKNPADPNFLVTPRGCKKRVQRVMTIEDVNQLQKIIEPFEVRERLIVNLPLLAGMRPGEIFGLRRGDVMERFANISRRIYRGDLDTPKNDKSRPAGFSRSLVRDLEAWMRESPDTGPDGWLFPSERLVTPITGDNVWRRRIRPKLKEKGLGWVNFQVLRRTNSSLMWDKKVDPKVIADQQGHTLDVAANVYTQTSVERLIEGVETLETALVN